MEAVLAVSQFGQMHPPAPGFTEKDLARSERKGWFATVYVITGSNTGIGKELAKILYSKNAKIYIAARNELKGLAAIESIKADLPYSSGTLIFLHLELDDLTLVSQAARALLSQETRLDVLFNNAGVMHPPSGSVTKQGYELTLGTNNLGHHLFTKLVTPLLIRTAQVAPASSVRVVWLGSLYTYAAPKNGMDLNNLDYKIDQDNHYKYNVSKAGSWYEAVEYARKYRKDGIVSVALNPSNLKSDLQRHMSKLEIIPWGRFGKLRNDLERGALPVSEGGTGMAQKWVAWLEEQVCKYE
ncbi:hypothetical protein ACHAQJ_007181 [Trichoderma viride]